MARVFEIQAFGFNEAAGKLKRVAIRFRNARPAFELIQEILESGEQRIFKNLRGKYVDTGALMESLTQPSADGAIREAHMAGVDFGTDIWYARFHRDEKGKLPYLKILTKERQQIRETVMGYVVGDMDVTV
jgi:hypothetical protein